MTRKPAFWIILAVLGVTGAGLSARLFPRAFPILSVDIEMDRGEALEEARTLAQRFNWPPAEFRQAASFSNLDPTFQTYMELEGGGLDRLNRLVEDGVFTLYAWRVRQFSAGAVEEADVWFTPNGDPYGFRLRLSEDAPGNNLAAEEALTLALNGASESWGVDPSFFHPLESSQQEQPGGRLDHTFVFERNDQLLGDARVRLRLRVAGDRLIEVSPFLYVPDAFVRRYQDTRNTNESISLAGTVVFLLLFLILGGGFGAIHLLKTRGLDWKAPVIWGGVVAGLLAADSLNSLPLAWMGYDTAIPPQVFVGSMVLTACLTFVAGAGFLALLFMVGEGLLRIGFPNQIRLWKMWSPGVANSTPALGRIGAPYLILGLELGFVVVFYLVMSRFAGWWSPADALAEPDLLATHMPWLTAVGTSLFAAFSEETVFRAIPIGAAAYIGHRRGRPWVWIWGAVVLQALVFGASHANYPQQPPYARVVEILPTYLMWGAVVVFFGLVPSIIGHFIYDLVFFSLPLFAADTAGIWVDRTVVVVAGLLPLLIVFLARLRFGGATDVPSEALNREWARPEGPSGQPGPLAELSRQVPWGGREGTLAPAQGPAGDGTDSGKGEIPERQGWIRPARSSGATGFLVLAAFIGTTLWARGIDPEPPPRLTLTRSQALARAYEALEERGVVLSPDWTPLWSISQDGGDAGQFVWREGSEGEYRALLGTFLGKPGWQVRFVNFQLPPEERAESYIVRFATGGGGARITHVLPEDRPGQDLPEEAARDLALGALLEAFAMNREELREVSAEKSARPNRTDWTFTFSPMEAFQIPEGEGRVEVQIAGDEVVGVRRFVHVPEDWEREWRGELSRRALARIPSAGLLLLVTVAGMVLALVKWARGSLATKPLRTLTAAMALVLFLSALNEWPNARSSFSTLISLGNQVVLALLGIGLAMAAVAVGVGLLGALGHTWVPRDAPGDRRGIWTGLALGTFFVGMEALLSGLIRTGPPAWPGYSGAVAFLPFASPALTGLTAFLALTAACLLTLSVLQRLRGTPWSWAGLLLLLVIGLTLASDSPGSSRLTWIGQAAGMAVSLRILWALCRRWGWSILPGAMAAPVLLNALETAMAQPFPGSATGALVGAGVVILAAHRWTRTL